ncbi:hypothetical protein AL01_04125 [Bombella intestini]|uniref:Uncharacterized protein n=1 Tax=Bombella intestini TaxID=1539051 RepID=A0A1S8GQD0_9PROT|nr:hypothetical protein [Bombella intestini]OOL18924.1 hypothetical protein AL01_04125 [Bombella intestini]
MSQKKILILPNYNKNPEIPVLVQENPNESWKISDYRSEIPSDLPKGASRGIPNSIVGQNNRDGFVLGRIIRRNIPVVFLACHAGQDNTGRTVFLTLVSTGPTSSLNSEEPTLHIPENILSSLENDLKALVPDDQFPALKKAISTLNSRGDAASQAALQKMWNNFQTKRQYQYFTSVSFQGASAYPPDSEFACFGGAGGQGSPLAEGAGKAKYLVSAIVLLICFIILVRQCSSPQDNTPHPPHNTRQSKNDAPIAQPSLETVAQNEASTSSVATVETTTDTPPLKEDNSL